MAVTDRAKLNLYKKLIEVLGQEDADTLMDLVFEARARSMRPGHDTDLRVEIAALRAEVGELRAELARLRTRSPRHLSRSLTL